MTEMIETYVKTVYMAHLYSYSCSQLAHTLCSKLLLDYIHSTKLVTFFQSVSCLLDVSADRSS